MILVFYDENMDVHILEYSNSTGVFTLTKEEMYANPNTSAKEFKDSLGVSGDFLATILLQNQSRFKGKRVIIFDNDRYDYLHCNPEVSDMLFLYRKEIAIIKAEVTVEDAKAVAIWLNTHSPK